MKFAFQWKLTCRKIGVHKVCELVRKVWFSAHQMNITCAMALNRHFLLSARGLNIHLSKHSLMMTCWVYNWAHIHIENTLCAKNHYFYTRCWKFEMIGNLGKKILFQLLHAVKWIKHFNLCGDSMDYTMVCMVKILLANEGRWTKPFYRYRKFSSEHFSHISSQRNEI